MAASLKLIAQAERHGARTAVIDARGRYPYRQLLDDSAKVAAQLLGPRRDLEEARVAFLVAPGFDYVAVQWGIWRAGGVAVPLGQMHPEPELEYVLQDAAVSAVVADMEGAQRLAPLAARHGLPMLPATKLAMARPAERELPAVTADRRAMILYTSGTTSRPKGVVSLHRTIEAQVESLVEAWAWSPEDHVLHVLPLHHIHGIINILTCALWSGACCEFLTPFDPGRVWRRIARGGLTLFMAVPTIYYRLMAAWEAAAATERQQMTAGCSEMRLMVSGSAALPVSLLQRWQQATGHVLLERYGMTEIGMALSNPLAGRRVPGAVGTPLPGVQVRLVDEAGEPVEAGTPGEIEVRSPTVFAEYWRRPEATQAAFRHGWFRTGDVAVFDDGVYRILGRRSVDIIKTGGYKVSALQIEEVLREHPAIRQCAVVGVPDAQWGEQVAACVVLAPGTQLDLASLRRWAKQRLAAYKVPARLLCVDRLPSNAMGKVQKPAVTALFRGEASTTAMGARPCQKTIPWWRALRSGRETGLPLTHPEPHVPGVIAPDRPSLAV